MKNLKTDKAAVSKAVAATIPMVRAFTILEGYTAFRKDRVAFAGWTNAAFETAGLVTFNKAGLPIKSRSKSQGQLLKMLIKSSAWGHWHKEGRLETSDKGITEITTAGLNELQARLEGRSKGYNTTREAVQAAVVAQREGGEFTVGKNTYLADSEIACKKA